MKSLISHPGVKLLALFIALIFWTLVSAPRREKSIERMVEMPLSLVGLPRDLIITTPVPDSVNVRLRGRPSVLSGSSKNMEATLDLSGSRQGEVRLPIGPQSLALPQDVEVAEVLQGRGDRRGGRPVVVRDLLGVLDLGDRREEFPEVVGQVRVPVAVLLDARRLAAAEPVVELLDQPVEPVVVAGRVVAGHGRTLRCGPVRRSHPRARPRGRP